MPATYNTARALVRTKDPKVVKARKVVTSIIYANTSVLIPLNTMLKKAGLTLPQFNILRILRGRNGEPASLQDVSSQMIHMNANTTRVFDKLITKELALKQISSEDARQVELTITKKGIDLLASIDDAHNAIDINLVHNLTEKEQDTLIKLLEKI